MLTKFDLVISKLDVEKLVIDKLETAPNDLSKLNNVIDNDVLKNTRYDELLEKVKTFDAIDTSALVKKFDCNTKSKEIEQEIPEHDKFNTTGDLINQNKTKKSFDDR